MKIWLTFLLVLGLAVSVSAQGHTPIGFFQGSAATRFAGAIKSAGGTVDITTLNCLETFVSRAVAHNYWGKIKAAYPMVGGSAISESFNLVDPARFRIVWTGTNHMTFSAAGVKGDNTIGVYGDTGITMGTDISGNVGMLFSLTSWALIGAPSSSPYEELYAWSLDGANSMFANISGTDSLLTSHLSVNFGGFSPACFTAGSPAGTFTGIFAVSRIDGSNVKVYNQTTSTNVANGNFGGGTSHILVLGAASVFASGNIMSSAFFHQGMTDQNMTDFRSDVAAFITCVAVK